MSILNSSKRRQLIIFFLLLISSAALKIYYEYHAWTQNRRSSVVDRGRPDSPDGNTDLNTGSSFIVNTSNCKIPDFDPWHRSWRLQKGKCLTRELRNPHCERRVNRKWMYVNGSVLNVNLTAVQESGFTWNFRGIHCCFRVLLRSNQSGKYNDDTILYSSDCYPITKVQTEMNVEFIRVLCFSTSNPFQFLDVLYREYFAFAIPSAPVKEKISRWKTQNQDIPPNVILLAVESNSRLNSRRWLPKSVELLRKIGAVEMFGYTKVGENTYPNTVPILTGMHDWEMELEYCTTKNGTHDKCPYIWKAFHRAGYVTAMGEDVPHLTCFNQASYGFEKKPTDFYYRPFSFAIAKRGPRERGWTMKCIGGYRSEQILLTYISDILNRVVELAPTFVFSWLTAYSHECSQSVRFIDDSIEKFLMDLSTNTNSIIFFMSDHGERYGKFRQTSMGWYEDKLPTMWLYLPPKVREKFPDWQTALETNSRRLTSPFDLYHSFIHVLDAFDWGKVLNLEKTTPRYKVGQTFFMEVPENRTCEQAGIPSAFCACAQPQTLDLKDENVRKSVDGAVNATLNFMKSNLPSQCEVQKLKSIISAKSINTQKGPQVFVISLVTGPGDFRFEISVQAKSKGGTSKSKESSTEFLVDNFSNILRLNQMEGNFNCVENRLFQRYCYCK